MAGRDEDSRFARLLALVSGTADMRDDIVPECPPQDFLIFPVTRLGSVEKIMSLPAYHLGWFWFDSFNSSPRVDFDMMSLWARGEVHQQTNNKSFNQTGSSYE